MYYNVDDDSDDDDDDDDAMMMMMMMMTMTVVIIMMCEPPQSKCTWTCHKSHFMWQFTRTWPDTDHTTSIKHRTLTVTVRTPQCCHTAWGKMIMQTANI